MNSAILSICRTGIVEMANHDVQLRADGHLKTLRQSPLQNLRRLPEEASTNHIKARLSKAR